MADAVARRLRGDGAIVALESTVIAHGLPRPANLDAARACERACRETGATPATIAIARGELIVGADDELLRALAETAGVRKVSTRDIAPTLALGELGATTVAASVEVAALAGIRVLATGGIGGVHRGAERTDDVSADLAAIARYPVVVVCAGAKVILDIPRTLERLESLGVPVITVGSDEFPAFTVRSSGHRSPYRVEDVAGAAAIARVRREQGGGVVVAVPVEERFALDQRDAERAVAAAEAEAARLGIGGGDVTPFLLREIADRDTRAVHANVELLVANARFASELALTMHA